MTRKHFTAIAETIRFLPLTPEERLTVAREFADTCRRFNQGFKRERFIEAATKPLKGEPGYVPS